MSYFKFKNIFLVLFVSITLASCSGGGGGGSDSSSSDTSSIFGSNSKSAGTGVRVLNGAIDATPVDLYSSEKVEVLSTARFGLGYPFVSLSTSTQILNLTPTKNPGNIIASKEITLANNSRATLLLYGSNRKFGLNSNLLLDSRPADLSKDLSAIRVIHAVIEASQVTLSVTGQNSVATFGGASEYLQVPAGANIVTATRTADANSIHSATYELQGGKSYSLFVSGQLGYFVSAKFLED